MKIIFTSSFIFALLFMGNVLNAAWSIPTGAPSESSDSLPPVTVGATDQVKTGGLSVGSLLVDDSVHIQGNVVGSPSGMVTLEVNGKFGSDEFCSEMGGACFTASDMVDLIAKINP